MSRRCAYTSLRLLVEASLRLYKSSPEAAKGLNNREREKDILISLNKVLSEIQMLQEAVDGESESETDSEPAEQENVDWERSCSQCEDDCVKLIVVDMVCMLGSLSEFIQHSAVNVLVTLSELMSKSEKDWEIFISLLSRCLERAISNSLSCSSTLSNTDNHELASVLSGGVVNKSLGNVNWPVASSIIQIYHKILKILKQDYEEKLVQVCLKYIHSWLSYVPWSSIGEVLVDQSTDDDHPETFCYKAMGAKLKMLLLGNLLQLLCSLVDRGCYSESAPSLELRHQVLQKIQNMVPLLSSWCLHAQRIVSSSSIHHYFKHKLLVLMVRLVTDISADRDIFHSCLELLHKHFDDVLNQKLTLIEEAHCACLQDSPFSHGAYEEGVSKASQKHLQRLSILLFLKCTVTMITLEAKRNLLCVCANSLTPAESEFRCCDSRKGMAELYIWLLGQQPIDCHMDFDTYVEMCMTFASSLLQLFVHEDDMLFQVLLQVFKLPSSTEQLFHEDNFSLKVVKCDIVFHISNILNPVLLFHIFLSKLQYDHQILLDYLISKDVGLICAEYMLRCLRRVSESWRSFMQYSYEKVPIQSKKKRKMSPKQVFEKARDETTIHVERGKAFEEAKQCLLSLRVSIESLHQRRLFPYNAEVLLRRLHRFEELCLNGENENFGEP